MNPFQMLILFFGRVCLSSIFILSSLNKLMDWQAAKTLFTTTVSNIHGMEQIHPFLSEATNHISLFLGVGVGFELIGGALLFLGLKPRFGAFLLLLFLIPTTMLFHPFWLLNGTEKELQMVMFLKNLS